VSCDSCHVTRVTTNCKSSLTHWQQTGLYFTFPTVSTETLNYYLIVILLWMKASKPKLNPDKTYLIKLWRTTPDRPLYTSLHQEIDQFLIESVCSTLHTTFNQAHNIIYYYVTSFIIKFEQLLYNKYIWVLIKVYDPNLSATLNR